ncbi:histidine kinase, partial [Vibrio cholerae]
MPIVWISHQIRRMNMVKNTMLNRLNELPRLSKVLQELLDMA